MGLYAHFLEGVRILCVGNEGIQDVRFQELRTTVSEVARIERS